MGRGAGCQQANTGGFGHVQDCAGGRCGQLNANDFPGRRKRQIVDALNAAVNALTEEALSAEKSAVALNEEALSAEESVNDEKGWRSRFRRWRSRFTRLSVARMFQVGVGGLSVKLAVL